MNLDNISIPTLEEERTRLLNLIDNKFYKAEGSIFYDIMSIIAEDNIKNLKLIKEVFKNSFGLYSNGKYLDLKVNEVGLERKQGTKAKGVVTFKREEKKEPIRIYAGTIVLCDNLEYITLNDVILEDKEIDAKIESVGIGTVYNVLENKINKIGITISGVDGVINKEPIKHGQDEEDDEDLRKRYIEKIKEPATSGNVFDYKRWALSIDGIGGVKVVPLANGNGTVKVIVISSIGQQVTTEKLKEVKTYIDSVRPIGATVEVINATPKTINISLKVVLNDNSDIEKAKEELKLIYSKYISQANIDSENISFGKLNYLTYQAINIKSYEEFKLNNTIGDIEIESGSIAVLGEVVVNEKTT